MKAALLKAHLGMLGSALILAGCGFADATEKRAQIECLNHLKQLGVAAVLEAQDHENTIPGNFLFLTNHGISPSILICASDPSRKAPPTSVPNPQLILSQLASTNISYQLVNPGGRMTPSNSEAIVRCPFHQQASYLDGQQIKARSEKGK